ncbi:MAG: B12-binding domain-containing radical SAM protein [Acidobacteriota bacterium]
MEKILLTSVVRPFGGPGEGDSVGAELFHAQVTRAQGVFSPRQVIRCWAIDYIAQNIEFPSVVLHYPSERELIRELRTGNYPYVGINFVVATFHKVRRMVQLIRKHSPQSSIILGGYGTVLPDEILTPVSDHICREEGIGFMRRLLGESREYTLQHPYAPIPAPSMFSYQRNAKVAHLTAGLGCPNGCDFCCTSHFFKRKYVPYLKTGREIYQELCAMQRQAEEQGDTLSGMIFIDEDFFLYKRRAREYLECVREGGKPFNIMGFGSVKGLSQFTADEIAEMGFGIIWTAYEGTESGYQKLQGQSLETLYSSLRSRGVAVLSSMIIGFPYQDRAQILQEFDRLMKLGPALTQILIYFAFPGTPFHKQVLEEERYLPEYQKNPDLRRWDGFAMHFKHPHFEAPELEALQKELYQQDFQRLGPSMVRLVQVWLEGYRTLRTSANPLLRARAERLRQEVIETLPGLYPAMLLGPNRATRAEARQLFNEIRAEIGSLSLGQRLTGWGTLPLVAWTWLASRLRIFQQPALLRIEHRVPPDQCRSKAKSAVMRLQGGFHARPVQVLAEDLARNAKDVLTHFLPKGWGDNEEFSTRAATQPLAVDVDP